jgi:hypothetical protein
MSGVAVGVDATPEMAMPHEPGEPVDLGTGAATFGFGSELGPVRYFV